MLSDKQLVFVMAANVIITFAVIAWAIKKIGEGDE